VSHSQYRPRRYFLWQSVVARPYLCRHGLKLKKNTLSPLSVPHLTLCSHSRHSAEPRHCAKQSFPPSPGRQHRARNLTIAEPERPLCCLHRALPRLFLRRGDLNAFGHCSGQTPPPGASPEYCAPLRPPCRRPQLLLRATTIVPRCSVSTAGSSPTLVSTPSSEPQNQPPRRRLAPRTPSPPTTASSLPDLAAAVVHQRGPLFLVVGCQVKS
jgi:hypothetical protein